MSDEKEATQNDENQCLEFPSDDDVFYGVVTERDSKGAFQSAGAIIHALDLQTAYALSRATNAANNFQAYFGRSAVVAMRPLIGDDAQIDSIIENYPFDTYFCPVVEFNGSFHIVETRLADAASPRKQVSRLKAYTSIRPVKGFLAVFTLPDAL